MEPQIDLVDAFKPISSMDVTTMILRRSISFQTALTYYLKSLDLID